MRNTGLARCPRCDAYDAWEDGVTRAESLGLVMLEHTCGVCHGIWRVPISQPVTLGPSPNTTEDREP